MRIPVISTSRSTSLIAEDIVAHGIVVVDTVRPHAILLAQELREELGIELADHEQEDAVFLLHLSCDVEPVEEYGWVDYYVHSETSPVDAMDAIEFVRKAVHQWAVAGKPDYFVAQLPSLR
ncbi:hypothetical protein [Stenotrophomonas maltophilia]|uniref:hypothetical protein n=1 Tax=Stenotrophomonas maltophilia TaxID=40324 RepID=UPI0008020FE7|nr:hypothetical protein [Stenotrophomonas maltophilia]OBU49540.1 hypothetical protein A9K69_19590 [Stenotrophomonas maltophilia]